MLEINLGNKTLVVGVAIALILAYGLVNFDSGRNETRAFPAVDAAATPAQAYVAPASETQPESHATAPSSTEPQVEPANQEVVDPAMDTGALSEIAQDRPEVAAQDIDDYHRERRERFLRGR